MTLEQLAQCGRPWAEERAKIAIELSSALETGAITRDEFLELTQDLIRADQLNSDADDVETKVALEVGIRQLISIVSSIV